MIIPVIPGVRMEKNTIDALSIRIADSHARTRCLSADCPRDFFFEHKFKIFAESEDEELCLLIGEGVFHTIAHFEMINAHVDIEDMAGEISDALKRTAETILEVGSGGLNPDLFETLGAWCLHLDKIILYQSYRGFGLGLAAVQAIIDRYATGDGLITLEPWPLQKDYNDEYYDVNGDYRFDLLPQDPDEAIAKLRELYEHMGFEQVNRSGVWALDQSQIHPRMEMPAGVELMFPVEILDNAD